MTALWNGLSPGEQFALVCIPTFTAAILAAVCAGPVLAWVEAWLAGCARPLGRRGRG